MLGSNFWHANSQLVSWIVAGVTYALGICFTPSMWLPADARWTVQHPLVQHSSVFSPRKIYYTGWTQKRCLIHSISVELGASPTQ